MKLVDTPFEYKKRVVLDQEKSKLSLGEVYEAEYLRQMEEEEGDVKDDPQHAEIKKMMESLFVKLDALSNFHYTPKPVSACVVIHGAARYLGVLVLVSWEYFLCCDKMLFVM